MKDSLIEIQFRIKKTEALKFIKTSVKIKKDED